ncbi:MAG: amidase family protein [Burkholderiaceae bacterium]|nr:amidase family protein [Burkholderiaceae bacterium]
MATGNELIRMSATEAVARLRRREITPLELVDAAAARIEEVDGRVNALPIRFIDQAREAARRFTDRKPPQDPPPGWLAGLPIAAKDYNDVAGQRTTFGSPIFADAVASASDHTVTTLEANGAIFMAKSNVPEFAGSNTFNPVFGATRNPWNLAMTAGGSSGGAAAALASGTQWLAMGSDLGGSLRIPASYCGIVGMRPSVGRVPRGGGLPAFDPLWVEGPMARNVADLALMLDALSVPHPHDPLVMPAPEVPFSVAVQGATPPRRVGFTPDLGLSSVDPEVADICRSAALRLGAAGTVVEDASPDFANSIETFQTLRALLFAALRGELLEIERERINPSIVWNIEKGLQLGIDEVIRAERERTALYHRVAGFFDRYDLLLCPTVAVPPFPVEQAYPTRIGDQELSSYIDWMFLTFVVTLTGCPALSLPCGFTRSGMPVGLQIIGRSRADAAVLAAAALLEGEFGIAGRLPIDPIGAAGDAGASGAV